MDESGWQADRASGPYQRSAPRSITPCSAVPSPLAGSRRVPSSARLAWGAIRHLAPVRHARPPASPAYDCTARRGGDRDFGLHAVNLLHPSLQRALVAYGAGATIAGAITFAVRLGDPWSLLGSGAGALIAAGALRLMGRTFAMQVRNLEELGFRRMVLGVGALAALFGAALFVLAIARWQFGVVADTVLWTSAAWGLVNLVGAWAAVRRLARWLEPPGAPRDDQPGGHG